MNENVDNHCFILHESHGNMNQIELFTGLHYYFNVMH